MSVPPTNTSLVCPRTTTLYIGLLFAIAVTLAVSLMKSER